MRQIDKLYFGESISKRHHKRITKQLTLGNKKMKKDFLVIVVSEKAKSVCQLISFDEYALWMDLERSFVLIGAVSDYDEFTQFLMKLVEETLLEYVDITTDTLKKKLLGDLNNDKNND